MPSPRCRRASRSALCVLLVLSVASLATPSRAVDARTAAVAQIPVASLTPEAQQKLNAVLQRPTLYRRMPAETLECDPEMFTFLVRRPEVLVGVWEAMGITKVKTRRLGPYELEGLDSAGTTCQLELIYGTPSIHVYYGTGRYDGPLLAQGITGRGVFVVHSQYTASPTGRATVRSEMDIFLQLDSLGIDLVARTIQPLMWNTAEQNFRESAKYVSQVSQAAEMNPDGMHDLAGRLPQLNPDVRDQLREVVDRVAARADARWSATEPQLR